MTYITSLLAFLVAIGILITIHELGHFLMARLFKFPTPVFSIGFGKKLLYKQWRDVEFRLSAIPLGGYVKILGMGYDESSIVSGDEPQLRGKRWQRALILLAGPGMNILLALLLIAGVYMVGVEAPAYLNEPPVIEYIFPDSPAVQAGFQIGDRIEALGNKRIQTWEEFQMQSVILGGDTIPVTVERNGEPLTLPLTIEKVGNYDLGWVGVSPAIYPVIDQVTAGGPADMAGVKPGDRILALNGERVTYSRFSDMVSSLPNETISLEIQRGSNTQTLDVTLGEQDGRGLMGIMYRLDEGAFTIRRYALISALKISIKENIRDATLALKIVQRLLRGRGSLRQMSGPIDIARYSGEALRSGFNDFINLLGRISLQLGIFNLLPIPVLDGGYLLILLIEGVRRRELPLKLKERVLTTGFYLLITLMVVVLYIDFVRNVF